MDEVKKLRQNGKNGEAAQFLRKLPQTLQACHEWSILSFYLGDREAGAFHVTVEEITARNPDQHSLALKNAVWYAAPITAERTVSLTTRLAKPQYVPTNPSIINDGTGYLVALRTVNFRQRFAKEYTIPPEFNGVAMTTNYFLRLSDTFEVSSEVEISDPPRVRAETGKHVRGAEDIRLHTTTDNKLRGSFTLINSANCAAGVIRIGRVEIDPSGTTTEVVELPSPFGVSCEKNWLPFRFKERDAFYYSSFPPTVVDENGAVVHQTIPHFNFEAFRGSAGPLPYEGGYLVVVHEVCWIPQGRQYFHRLVWFSLDFSFVDVSRPFIFDHLGVEFCSGAAVYNNGLILAYGSEDREARLALVPWEAVRSMWLHFTSRLSAYLGQVPEPVIS